MSNEHTQTMRSLAEAARAAALRLAVAGSDAKNRVLLSLAARLENSIPTLLVANARDLEAAYAARLPAPMIDRLTLNEQRIRQIAQSVREVVVLPDPVGTELERTTRPNGIVIRKVRVPIGVVAIVYESRPNVTIDCAVLCLKSGNAAILRGGKEAIHSNTALAQLIADALAENQLPREAVTLVPTTDRAALEALLKIDDLIQCVIPRGGEGLIRFVASNSTIPVIKHYKGVCFLYADRAADPAMAERIAVNAKLQRPSACNAAEQLLVHKDVAPTLLPRIARALLAARPNGVEFRCDAESAAILDREKIKQTSAKPEDFQTEFLDYILAVRVVDSLDAAIATVNRDSSNHSDAIITSDETAARRFQGEVDSATVYWNASTRFTDGYEFGLGAEIGISTDRLHARGPMGLAELCTYKFLIDGTGQLRA